MAAAARFGGLDRTDRMLEYQLGWSTIRSTQQEGILIHLLKLAGQADAIDQIDSDHLADEVAQERGLQRVRRWLGPGLGGLPFSILAGRFGEVVS